MGRNARRAALLALSFFAGVCLSGCAAMLERSYETSQRHVNTPVTAEDASYVRVENYQELVSAVLYLVSQREETGVIRLYDYDGDAEADLTRACLEVSTQDPLGAYAVDYIKHESTRVVSYYQATLFIRYRRSEKQMTSIVRVTGSTAIRQKVRAALAGFVSEVVLRVSYFAESEESIRTLIRQAYRDTPEAALGMPEARISIYPASGRDRVLEIVFTYPERAATLRARSAQLLALAKQMSAPLLGLDPYEAAVQAAGALAEATIYDPLRPATAYAALVEGAAGGEGLAQAYVLLCREAGTDCELLEGTRLGEDWSWTAVLCGDGGTFYLDPVYGDGSLHTAEEMVLLGYDWRDAPAPEAEPDASPGP